MSAMKRISILGVTGSIGNSALNVIDNHKGVFQLVAVSTNRNIDKLISIIDKYRPEYAVCSDTDYFYNIYGKYEIVYNGVKIYSGSDALDKICTDTSNDIILNAISGKSGLPPSIKILQSGIDIALANKESIVCAGDSLFVIAKKNNAKIIPVDSEHSAIFSLLYGKDQNTVRRLHITASGGPFLNKNKDTWGSVTLKDALKHPTWSMGQKISIDSATMANKGLEVIEAHYLFNMSYDNINVLIHPQSLIHSMVETIDGEIYAQIGPKDMSIPIQNALYYPEIGCNNFNVLDFSHGIKLELSPVDTDKFKMLSYAYYCGRKGGYYTAFYNYINEYLVDYFIKGKINFVDIEKYTDKAINLSLKETLVAEENFSLDKLSEIDVYAKTILHDFLRG